MKDHDRIGAAWEDLRAELGQQTTRAEAAEQEAHELREQLAEVSRQRDALRTSLDELSAAILNARPRRGNRR